MSLDWRARQSRSERMRTTGRYLFPVGALVLALLVPAAVGAAAAAPADGGLTQPAGAARLAGLDVDRATVLDLQRAIREHRISSVLLTLFYLRRIHNLNPTLHAVIETNPDAVREAADSDLHRARHGQRSALEGIPVLLKDNVGTADREHSTAGSLALGDSRPARDGFLGKRLREAGAVGPGTAPLPEA